MTAAPHRLPPLPFAASALDPVISARTLEHHHGKHHRGYVDALNALVAGTDWADMSLQETITATHHQVESRKTYNNAAQAWNHAFYWQSLRPGGGGQPPAAIKPLIEAAFGSVKACTDALAAAATERFGSGWVWLVDQGGKLAVVHTANADSPATLTCRPLLVLDVWEHAYYLDYQERRAAHVKAVLDKLLDWGFAAENLHQRDSRRTETTTEDGRC
jgi:Fe-Mn family superoxide dismutase